MDNDDFSFCPTGVVEGQDRVDAQKLAENIGGIKLENKIENGVDSRHNDSISKNNNSGNHDDTKQKKQGGTVGSLSFTVTDMSSSPVKKPNLSTSVVVKKGAAPRNKVPFEKGYSQMDWMKLSRTHPDLAGLNGQSNKRLITLNEVKQHQSEGSMWTVLKGRVYNITPYMKFHPGGVDMLMKGVGKDCTSLFNKYHAWVNADILLEKCLVGILDDTKK